jgi:PII-like signaling protein
MSSYLRQKEAIVRIQTQIKKKELPFNPDLPDVIETIDRAEKLEQLFQAIYSTAKQEREICLHCNSVANVIEDSGLNGPNNRRKT